jgi:uncharacterized membrane protein (UPF0127 family)
MQIENVSRNTILVSRVKVAANTFQRLVGCIGQHTFRSEEGLYLTPCRGVHTLGMNIPIDAVYINSQGVVLKVVTLQPWRWGPYIPACRGVLELRAGKCKAERCCPGNQLRQIKGNGW